MATKKTDWKKERSKIQDKDWQDTGRVVLEGGERESKGNDGYFQKIDSIAERMQILEANRKMYQDLRKMKKKKLPHKGLFGGGE